MHFSRVREKSVGYFQIREAVYILVVKDAIIMRVHIGVGLGYERSLNVFQFLTL